MHKKYRATQVHPEVRTFAARVLIGLEKLGVNRQLILDVMSEAGYEPSTRTVRRHAKQTRSGENLFSLEKTSGRPSMLDEKEREICAGFVLAQNIARKEVHLNDYISFVSDNFNVNRVHSKKMTKPKPSYYWTSSDSDSLPSAA